MKEAKFSPPPPDSLHCSFQFLAMKIFKSLSCIVCEAPLAPIENQPRSPIVLDCGKAMCRECFQKERSTKQADRKHQCEAGDKCFGSFNSAYFLIDVLSHDSLKLSAMGDGYLLCKSFKCPVCDDEFANTLQGKSPFCLWQCHHIVCTSCFKNAPRLNEKPNQNGKTYEVKCPICSEIASSPSDKWTEDEQARSNSELRDFLTELPEMTRQLEGTCRFCEECKREQHIEDLFHCEECEKNFCASCGFKKHRFHKTIEISAIEAPKIVDRLQKLSNTYENSFPELHKELVDDIGTFGTKLLSKKENFKQPSNYQDLQKLNMKFEAISDEYFTHLRKYNGKVKDLIKSLHDE